jgi:hypothetical protein
MKKIYLTISILLFIALKIIAQTVTINTQGVTQPIPNIYKPGIFLVPKTPNGTNDFLNNGIHYNSIRIISIETALNYWTVSSINDVMAQLESQKNNILLANSRCDKLVLPILKMPLWLSSSTDTTSIGGGFMVFNAMPPANYTTWNLLMDSIVSKINNQWGLDPYYEIWNEPDGEYWQGTTNEYFEFFKNTYFAIKINHPSAKVGGPTVSNFVSQFQTTTLPNGYLTHSQLDSTIIGLVIDSCVSWSAHLDFISWHKFGINLHAIENEMNYLNQKLINTGHGIVPYIVSEWNMTSSLRESTFNTAYMINYVQALKEYNIEGQMVAAWQDFSMNATEYTDTSEFHGDYGLLSWGALHKPAWKALKLLNRLDGELLDVYNSDYRNLNTISSYYNDTLKILISNYSLRGFEEAVFTLFFNYNINLTDLADNGYTISKLDSVFQGLITLPGSDSLTLAINAVIPVYQDAQTNFNNGRNLSIKIPNIVGTHSGTKILIDSTHNNIIYQYDSLLNIGYTRTAAVNYLYPNNTFDYESIYMIDSTYNFHIQANGVVLLQFYIPEITLSLQEKSKATNNQILFPNPTTGKFTIKINKNYKELKVYIYNNNGCLIFSSINQTEIDISDMPNSVYYVKTSIDNRTFIKKIIKTK